MRTNFLCLRIRTLTSASATIGAVTTAAMTQMAIKCVPTVIALNLQPDCVNIAHLFAHWSYSGRFIFDMYNIVCLSSVVMDTLVNVELQSCIMLRIPCPKNLDSGLH